MPKVENFKNWFWILVNVCLAIAALLMLSLGKYLFISGKTIPPARTISVSAEGKVVVTPDIATFSFSVVAEGQDPEKLQKDNVDKIAKAIEFLKAQGVEAKDIKTSGFNLYPRYEYNEKTRRSYISGYTLNQSVFVKVRDLTKVAVIIGGLPSRGINEVNGLTFDVDDQDKFLNQARKEAFEKAMAKAEEMAGYNGVSIHRVVNFSESTGGYPMPMYFKAEASMGRGGGDMAAPAPSIEPGSQEVRVNVSVTYEIW